MKKEWSKEETQKLEKLFGSIPTEQLVKQFGKSAQSLRCKANRLGLKGYIQYAPWSAEEIEQLKNMFPTTSTEELAKLFNRTVNSVRQKAFRLKLKKSKKYLKSIGLA